MLLRHLPPTHTHTETHAALSLSRRYIRRFLLVLNFDDIMLLRENLYDVSARNLWRSYSDRQKITKYILSSFHPKGKLFYLFFIYFKRLWLFVKCSVRGNTIHNCRRIYTPTSKHTIINTIMSTKFADHAL